MLKWLHRGFVALLLFLTVATLVGMLLPNRIARKIGHYSDAWSAEQSTLFSVGIDDRRVVIHLYHTKTTDIPNLENCYYAYDVAGANIRYEQTPTWSAPLIPGRPTPAERLVVEWIWGPDSISCTVSTKLDAVIPLWQFLVLFASYPTIFLNREYRRRRRWPSNACKYCDYDLTANESGVCPECGTPVQRDAEVEGTT